jgi:hypothetical protein
MYCDDIEESFKQISAYFNGEKTGYTLVLDTENVGVYSEIIQRLEADNSKKCTFVSSSCQKNELPNIESCINEISGEGDYVLIGISQALMLKSELDLEHQVDAILGKSISGHALVILSYCKQYIEKFSNRDPRINGRTILVNGLESRLPKIEIVKESNSRDLLTLEGVNHLLSYLENITELKLKEHGILGLKTRFSKAFFSNAMYQVVDADGIYDSLIKEYSDLAGATEKSYGTDQQWKWLKTQMQSYGNFSAVLYGELGASGNLELLIQDVEEEKNQMKHWLLWLALKSFGTNNKYLVKVLDDSTNEGEFEKCIYLTLSHVSINDNEFEELYLERKKLLDKIPENLPYIAEYCQKIGRYEKEAVYYLTDRSDNEKFEFVKCLGLYDYAEDEVYKAANHFSPMLNSYLQQFTFNPVNTKLGDSDGDLRDVLSQYFQEYKVQKITNKIFPYFKEMVNAFAIDRPYNKLRSRSSIVSQLDKEGTELFFFDALGVEYLSFIKSKCEEYGLVIEISVGRCELPSITEKNKEFVQYFSGNYRKIDDLDEVKHHSQIYNYEKRKEPIHIFRELEIIDTELRRIQSMLVQETISKAVIISDHGASRLAVINGQENKSSIELEESGIHSGRCCPIAENPNLEYAAYEDGFSVLANYERFKGGRKANVEVHGGATLEEVVVPIIMLSRKPSKVEYCFTDSIIRLKQKEVATLTLYCNIPMKQPKILVGQKFYEGEFVADNRHAKFIMPDLKRSREYTAYLYEGDTSLSVSLNFVIQKSMGQEIDLFA